MDLIKVTDKRTERLFLKVPRRIYRNDPVWVCPLDNNILEVFDPEKNTYYKHGIAERWVLKNVHGELIGRIAAFIDYRIAGTYDQPTGGMGFFECINDKEAARELFNTARNWLSEKGMEAMDGPINFGETDKYWGLLVDGFTHPSFDVPYNPPYYRDLFESYGFKTYYTMEGFHLDITKPLPERFMKISEWVMNKPGYSFSHFSWKEEERYVNDFASVYNQAWESFKKYFEPLEPEYIKRTLRKARPIIEEEFIWFAYFNNEPVAIFLMFPDLNMILKYLNGKLDLPGIIKFLWLKRRKCMTRAKGLLMGVIPRFQGHGLESAFIYQLLKVFERKKHFTEIEFSWVADFNPKMRKIFTSVGSIPAKNYITYRYLFDRTKEFKRYPIG